MKHKSDHEIDQVAVVFTLLRGMILFHKIIGSLRLFFAPFNLIYICYQAFNSSLYCTCHKQNIDGILAKFFNEMTVYHRHCKCRLLKEA